jgi:hypothetical protein
MDSSMVGRVVAQMMVICSLAPRHLAGLLSITRCLAAFPMLLSAGRINELLLPTLHCQQWWI